MQLKLLSSKLVYQPHSPPTKPDTFPRFCQEPRWASHDGIQCDFSVLEWLGMIVLTSHVSWTRYFFCFALVVSFVNFLFFRLFLSWTMYIREGLFCSLCCFLFCRVFLPFCLISGVFWCSPLACFVVLFVPTTSTARLLFPRVICEYIGFSVSHSVTTW